MQTVRERVAQEAEDTGTQTQEWVHVTVDVSEKGPFLTSISSVKKVHLSELLE